MNIDNLFGSRFHVLDALPSARSLPPYLPLSLQMIVFNTSHFLPPRITCIIRQFGAALLPLASAPFHLHILGLFDSSAEGGIVESGRPRRERLVLSVEGSKWRY